MNGVLVAWILGRLEFWIMLSNFPISVAKLCPRTSKKLLLLLLAVFGIVGFLLNNRISSISPTEVCYPKTNIVFLKTHKCAGSSVQNIMMRYGAAHKLNFVLPRTGNYLSHPAPFRRTLVEQPRTFQYNILAHHTRLDYTEIRAVMPRDSVYVTIVRNPIELFESLYYYYGFDKHYECDIHNFLRNRTKSDMMRRNRRIGRFGVNQMFFDLGGSPGSFNNETRVSKYLDKLESWFHLVLVAERMDESMVLLRHLMCWELDDVVTFKLNARKAGFKSNLTVEEKEELLQLNRVDSMLYDRFLAKFDKEVEAFGRERMAAEIVELNRRTRKWFQLCVEGELPAAEYRVPRKYNSSRRVVVFETRKNVTNSTCDSMTMTEIPYTNYLRKRQMPLFPKRFKVEHLSTKSELSKKRHKSHPLAKS